MAINYINIDINKVNKSKPILNKIGKDLFIHWILLNQIKNKKSTFKVNNSKVVFNIKKILEKQSFNILYNDLEINQYIHMLFKNIAEIENPKDVIANNIVFRIFNTIYAQENLGFIRETRYSFERISNKLNSIENINLFIEQRKKNNEKEEILKIIKVYEFIYKNNIHTKILKLNEVINQSNILKTIDILKKIPFVDEYKAYQIIMDLSNYNFYKFDKNLYIFLRNEVIYGLKELYDDFDSLSFNELLYKLYFTHNEMIKELYDINVNLNINDLDIILFDLSKVIKNIYGDSFNGEFLSNIDMQTINLKNRSKNSEDYHTQMADGRCLDII